MSTKELPNRTDVPVEKTWDLTLVYKTEAEAVGSFSRGAGA